MESKSYPVSMKGMLQLQEAINGRVGYSMVRFERAGLCIKVSVWGKESTFDKLVEAIQYLCGVKDAIIALTVIKSTEKKFFK